MKRIFTLRKWPCRKFSLVTSFLFVLVFIMDGFSQCIILPNAVEGISYTYLLSDGTNASGVAYHPGLDIYYAVIAGNPGFPMETFDPSGNALYQTNAGFDFRGLWWNSNTSQLEGNGYFTYGLWASDLDANGYALNTGTQLFTGQNQPSDQSCGDYDYDADEILYYFNGSVYRISRSTSALLGSYALTGSPVPMGNINTTSIAYTGCAGSEIALEDYVNKTILLFNKITGAYNCSSQLPANAVTSQSFRFSYANNLVWLYDVYTRTWASYSIFPGSAASLDLGNDTILCAGSTLVLNAGSSSLEYLWSTGSTDSSITVDTAGTYWISISNGSCLVSDTIVISDTLCSPLAVNSTDTLICEKFCVGFFDASQNDPTAWLWQFEGGSPATSAAQNPANICYSNAGIFDVTLITSSASGMDTLVLEDYIAVIPTPPLPVITQNGYELTSSIATAYQWQFNTVDIPGATDQTYLATQSGFYTVIVYDESGCKNSTSVTVVIVGIAMVKDEMNLSVFPNPTSGSFNIQLSNAPLSETISVRLTNALGQKIYAVETVGAAAIWNQEIKLNDFSNGMYFLEISTGHGFVREKVLLLK